MPIKTLFFRLKKKKIKRSLKIQNFFKKLTKKRFKLFKLKLKIRFFLFIKLTLNNLFGYVYNFYNFKNVKTKKLLAKLNFNSISLGMTKYKGPAKFSNIALETAGVLLSKKLRKLKIFKINLVLFTRLNRKIKEFLKGFSKIGKIKILRILFFSKFAHNGCRLKSKKRR